MAYRFALWALSALFALSCSQEPPVSSPSSAFAEESGPWQTVSINGATYRRVAAKPTETSQADLLITIPISYTVEDGAVRFSDTVQIAGRTYTADCGADNQPMPVGGDDVGDTQATAKSISVEYPPTGSTEFQFTDGGQFHLAENDVDYFRLRISKAVFLCATTNGNLDTQGTLYDSSGTVLDFDDDGLLDEDTPNDRNFIVCAPVDPGTYYVKVQASTDQTGPYSLTVVTLYVAGKVVAQSIEQQMKQMLR